MNERRIYEISDNGILFIQFKAEDGFVDYRYFLVDRNGSKTLSPIYEYEHEKDGTVKYLVKDKEKVGIFGHGTTIAFTDPSSEPTHLVFNQLGLEFFVSTFNGLDSVEKMEHFNQRVDSLIKLKNSR